MFGLTLSGEIKLGDLSIIVSAFVFIYTIILYFPSFSQIFIIYIILPLIFLIPSS
jgi:hypothetical protein